MSKRLTYAQVEEFVDLYTTKGLAACCERFSMRPFDVAREATLLNIQESCDFTQREQELLRKYKTTLGQGMIFILVNRCPKDFVSASDA